MALAKGKERISSIVFKGLKKEVRELAERGHISISKYVEQAIKEKVNRDRKRFNKD